jgi:hypothetical protein
MLSYPLASICTLDTGSFSVIESDGDNPMHTFPHACICTLNTGSFVVIETDGDKQTYAYFPTCMHLCSLPLHIS